MIVNNKSAQTIRNKAIKETLKLNKNGFIKDEDLNTIIEEIKNTTKFNELIDLSAIYSD